MKDIIKNMRYSLIPIVFFLISILIAIWSKDFGSLIFPFIWCSMNFIICFTLDNLIVEYERKIKYDRNTTK